MFCSILLEKGDVVKTPHKKKRRYLAALFVMAAVLCSLVVASAALATAPSTVYVNAAWAGTSIGTDPDGAGPATAMGTDAFSDIPSAEAAVTAGGTVYTTGSFSASDIALNKAVTVDGQNSTTVAVADAAQVNAFDLTANDITVKNLKINGPVSSSYKTYSWGSNISRGIVVSQGVTGFNITGNTIEDVRNGILIDGRNNTGSVTNNTIDNTKSAVSIQYTDGTGITLTGNGQGSNGNEWGVNQHLNGNWDGTTVHSNPYPGGTAPSSVQTALLNDSSANSNWAVQDQAYTAGNRTQAQVATTGSSGAQGSPLSPIGTIQGGIDAVVAGGTVNVAAGTYPENVTGNKYVTLDGAGSTTSGTVISPASGNAITVTGSGASSSSPLTIENVRVTTSGGNGVFFDAAVSHIALENVTAVGNNYGIEFHNSAAVTDLSLTSVSATGNSVGLRVATTGSVNGLTVKDSHFDGNTGEGWYTAANSGSTSNQDGFTNLNVTNTTFNTNALKGVYMEKLDHATFDGVTVNSSGTSGSYGSGFNVNEKYGTYHSITVKNSTVSNSGTGDTTNGTGFDIEARDDGGYSSNPATLDGVSLSNNTVTGNQIGIRVGEPGKNNAGPTNVVVSSSNISGNLSGSIDNQAQAVVDATGNWWGSASGPGTLTGVTTKPWATDSAFNTQSDNADLTALSLSAGTLNPTFNSATTTYTVSVDNRVTSVNVNPTANPGANTAVSGGSSLSVGNNTVSVTVTSADSSTTKVYTITVARAAAPSSGGSTSGGTSGGGTSGGGTTTPTTTTTTSGTTTTTVTPTSVAVTQTAPNQGATAHDVQPTQTGTASVVVQPATGGTNAQPPVPVQATWPAGTFTASVTVAVTPKPELSAPTPGNPNPPAVAGGLAVGNTVIQIVATDSSGKKVTTLDAPMKIHIDSAPGTYVPASSEDGSSWTPIPQLFSLPLPEGQADGYYVNADGSIDVYTRHLTFFGLLKDVQAPSQPTLTLKLGKKLYMTKSSKDNVQLAFYIVSLNGRTIKKTSHGYLPLPVHVGTWRVYAVDTSGNRSKPAVFRVVRVTVVTHGKHHKALRIVKG